MFFSLKKLIAYFIEPLTITFIVLGFGIYQLSKKQPNIRKGRLFIVLGTLFLFLSSWPSFTYFLVAPFEQKYAAIKSPDLTKNYEFIYVLGSGYTYNQQLPETSMLSPQALARIVEGIRIHRYYPRAKIIFSGYGGKQPQSFASIAAEAAMLLGVNKSDIILVEDAKDTIEEAQAAFQLIGNKPFYLVSSASHLSRGVGLFEKLGMNPTPAPTGFINRGGWDLSTPSSWGLYKAERGIYETVGSVWAWITGRL